MIFETVQIPSSQSTTILSNTYLKCSSAFGYGCGIIAYNTSNHMLIVNISQSTGTNWSGEDVVYVPQETPIANGLPQVSFSSYPANITFQYTVTPSGLGRKVLLAVTSPYNLNGTIWIAYKTYGSYIPQYTEIGSVSSGSYYSTATSTLATTTIFQQFPVKYVEQIDTIFTQNMSSLDYNLTAVAQDGPYGYGPGYLLNGLSNTGYWYQVGLSWDWPNYHGFRMNAAVFSPAAGHPNIVNDFIAFSGPVNAGDTVRLYLYFSNGNVIMYAYDWNTGSYARLLYSSENATYFVGNPYSYNGGFYTGLMTEQYYVNQNYSIEQPVTYISDGARISSAFLYMDEFNYTTGRNIWIRCSNSCILSYSLINTTQFQTLTYGNATIRANAYQVTTGGTVSTTASTTTSTTATSSISAPTTIPIISGTTLATTTVYTTTTLVGGINSAFSTIASSSTVSSTVDTSTINNTASVNNTNSIVNIIINIIKNFFKYL